VHAWRWQHSAGATGELCLTQQQHPSRPSKCVAAAHTVSIAENVPYSVSITGWHTTLACRLRHHCKVPTGANTMPAQRCCCCCYHDTNLACSCCMMCTVSHVADCSHNSESNCKPAWKGAMQHLRHACLVALFSSFPTHCAQQACGQHYANTVTVLAVTVHPSP
jgi:hypothetical protein